MTPEQKADKAARIFEVIAETAPHITPEDGLHLADRLAEMDLDQFQALWERRRADFPANMHLSEVRIASCLLDTILADESLYVEVHDECEKVVSPTRERHAIERATGCTGQTHYVVKRKVADGMFDRLGFIWLIHGNEWHVVTDYTDKPEIEALVEPSNKLAEEMGW